MPSLSQNTLGFNAFCSFNADAAAAAFFVQRGFTSPGFLRNGVGDYTFTLSDGVNMQTQGVVLGALQNATAGMMAVEVLTTTTFRVRTLNSAAAATDIDFWITVYEAGPA